MAGALELRSETSSGNIKNVKENGHDGVRGQAKKSQAFVKEKKIEINLRAKGRVVRQLYQLKQNHLMS